MDDLQKAVAKLRALSPRLNSAVDQAQRVVQQIENFLADECEVAVQAEVPVVYNDKGVAVTLLRYGRVEGKFRIAITNTDGDSHFISRAWTDCDRNEKLASFSALPKLLIQITKAVESQISSTTTTSNTVSQLISALGVGASSNGDGEIVEPPKLTLFVRPEETLTDTAIRAPSRPRPTSKVNPDGDGRRTHRKEEVKVG